MGYRKEIYDRALVAIQKRKTAAERLAQEHTEAFYAACPRAKQIEREIASTAASAAKSILRGTNAAQEMTNLRNRNLELQEERRRLLYSAGFPEDYLKPKYHCSACKDTGYLDGRMCQCFKELLRSEAYQELNALTPLALSSFEHFSLKYYPEEPLSEGEASPRRQMGMVLHFCQDYAKEFSPSSPSLLMYGGTGLGKTHLSLSIAKAAIDRGYGVIYGSAQNLALQLDKERFGNDGSDTMHHLLTCDLLILDDLGTEFSTGYINASIYNIVNSRLMGRHPTIINTNLTTLELQTRYTERFVSRLIGGYVFLSFLGRDIRQQKRMGQRF